MLLRRFVNHKPPRQTDVTSIAYLVVALLGFTVLSLQDFSHRELQALHL